MFFCDNARRYKSGFLSKRGDVVKNWKMRFFVLRPGDLSYFKTKDDALHGETPLNIFYLKASTVEKVAYSKHSKSCVIEISFAGAAERLRAAAFNVVLSIYMVYGA